MEDNLSMSLSSVIFKSQTYESLLTPEEKSILYKTVSSKCTSEKLKSECRDWKLFRNQEGIACKLGDMMASGSDDNENELFASCIINSDDYKSMSRDTRLQLMPRDTVYITSIVSNWNKLVQKWCAIGVEKEWKEENYARLYEITLSHYTAYCNNHPTKKVATISEQEDAEYILSETSFRKREEVFYSPDFADSTLRSAAGKLLDISLPSLSSLKYLAKAPFITARKNWTSHRIKEDSVLLDLEITAILSFCKGNKEDFFNKFTIKAVENGNSVSLKEEQWQFFAEDASVVSFVNINLAGAVSLPLAFKSFTTLDGIVKGEELFTRIFDGVNCQEQGDALLNIVFHQSDSIKKRYIKSLGSIHLSNDIFNEGVYFTSLFTLCASLFSQKENDGKESQQKATLLPSRTDILIDYKDESSAIQSMQLDEIPMQGKVVIGNYSFDMDEVNPAGLQSFQKSARELLMAMRKAGIAENYLNVLFDLNASVDASDVYDSLNRNENLVNGAQLAFVLRYLVADKSKAVNFALEAKDRKSYPAKDNKEWYVRPFDFISDSKILADRYLNLTDYIPETDYDKLPRNFVLLNSADSFKGLKVVRSRTENHSLLDYIYSKWIVDSACWENNKAIEGLLSQLQIDRAKVIISDRYSLSDEKLPEDVSSWMNSGANTEELSKRKVFIQEVFSLYGDTSEIVNVRKFISGESKDGMKLTGTVSVLLQDKVCKWIESKKIRLTESQYTSLKIIFDDSHVVDSIDFSKINCQIGMVNPSLKVNSYSIYKYDGIIPHHVTLNNSSKYEIYSYEDGAYCTDGNKIIVSTNSWDSLESILMRIASDNKCGFSSYDFLRFMEDQGMKTYEEEGNFKAIKAKYTALENEISQLRAALGRSNVDMSSIDDSYIGLDPERMGEALREARQAVRDYLRNHEGFDVPDEEENPDDWTRISGVKKGGEEYTVIVRSYRDSESRNFELNTSDWISLMEGNSMLWIYTKNGVECFPFRDLVKNKNRISLSFSTINTDYPKRMTALAESLRYFKGIRFDFGPNLSRGHSTAERFIRPEQKLNEALKEDDLAGLF